MKSSESQSYDEIETCVAESRKDSIPCRRAVCSNLLYPRTSQRFASFSQQAEQAGMLTICVTSAAPQRPLKQAYVHAVLPFRDWIRQGKRHPPMNVKFKKRPAPRCASIHSIGNLGIQDMIKAIHYYIDKIG